MIGGALHGKLVKHEQILDFFELTFFGWPCHGQGISFGGFAAPPLWFARFGGLGARVLQRIGLACTARGG